MDKREFAVIREIANNYQLSQRLLARKLGISLGLANLIIKRLVKKGYLKVSQLDAQKMQYILTPQGFAEKTKKSYHYTLESIRTVTNIKNKIQEIILAEYKNGKRKFAIQGNNELATIVEISLRNLNLEGLEFVNLGSNSLPNDNNFTPLDSKHLMGLTILNTEENTFENSNPRRVDIIQRLAELGVE